MAKCRYRLQSVREEDLESMSSDDDGNSDNIQVDNSSHPATFLTVEMHNAELNSHTYVYDADKSFKGMTLDALPNEDHYRDIRNLQGGALQRPTIEELKSGQLKPAPDVEEAMPQEKLKGKVVKFGWIEGVYMRCLLNIWGVMLFLRLTTVIGQCGIVQGLSVILLCNIVTTVTAISMSAVSTNGMIQGGGIYYMISRSLGPEFGGAIGIMFTVANSIAVATYLIGFCDSILDMIAEYNEDFNGIVGTLDARENDIRLIGAGTLVAILLLAVVGMDWVTRVQIGLLVLLIASQIDFIIGSFIPADSEGKYGFIGYNWDTFNDNLLTTHYHDYESDDDPNFFYWFGVFFPAVTGIVAGANLSGDLKDPSSAIPKGTLLAIGTTFVTYITYGAMIGGCYLPEASGSEQEYQAALTGNDTIVHYDDCSNRNSTDYCQYGSSNDQQTLSKISYTGYLVYAGCFAATLSSAIASLVGAPRVLQALAKDKLYPFIHFFSAGYGANNDPFRGYILVFFIALAMTMIGNLDFVSTILSNFFVAAYALINFSVFHATITKQPGWRPSFKYYNEWVSLLGTFLCVFVMFAIDWLTAIITMVVTFILYMYISYAKPEANWGSSTQAQQFVSTLRNVQTLSEQSEHVKNYRPKIVAFTGIPAHRLPLVDFANLIVKKQSLLICAHVSRDLPLSTFENLKSSVVMWLKDHGIRGFYSVSPNKSFDEGAVAQMNLAGLGRLSPNLVLLGFKNSWGDDAASTAEYFNVVNHAIDLKLAVAILRVKNGLDYSDIISQEEAIGIEEEIDDEGDVVIKDGSKKSNKKKAKKAAQVVYKGVDGRPLPKEVIANVTQFQAKHSGFIDVWWLYDDGGLTLLLPYILTTRKEFGGCQLRVFSLANRKDELDRETRNMASLLAKFRIDFSDVTVIPDVTKKAMDKTKQEFQEILQKSAITVPDSELLNQKEKTNRHLRLAELLREHSTGSEMVIMTLPVPRQGTYSPALYMAWLEIMTREMPPFLLVRGNQVSVLTYYS